MPLRPISPSPRLAWRSRLEPSGVAESLTCREPSRSSPTTRSNSSRTSREARGGADVVAGREQVAGVQADAEPLVAAGGVDQPRQLLERAAERAARAGGVLEVQRAVVGLGQRLGDRLRRAVERRVDIALERRAGMQHDADRAERGAGAQRRGQRGERLAADLVVLGGAVEQVDGVDEQRVDVRVLDRRVEAATSSALYSRGAHARGFWLKIWIERAPFSTPRSTALAGPPAGETWAPISMRRRSSMQPGCASASPRRRPAPCTSAGRARRCTTGCSRAATAAGACCASRTPTARAPRARTSSRSSRRCAGSGSTGTASPVFQSERADAPRRGR